ncbi:glucosamine-6-phosphate deaminase [Halalkalibacter krulwichiae]|uniref:Glucosamine-6-phosphate deaminase n=1 Tax=Halalkalibacter krulwichiae TaxID=199441 RepID=A0A1X9MMJ5_9BACI|nr:glucosamine-6-phosphate deaminase [Halalkalibacter krulwichiae]ARK32402.1 Glucosamine-6-phosphate deaminase 1 [Halalkalibacter krulwichiae]
MELIKTNDYQEMSRVAADIIIQKVKQSKQFTLGLATGSTPEGLYGNLIEDQKQNATSYRHVTTFNLDEYVGMKRSDPNSYHYYMKTQLFDSIDIPVSQIHLPKGDATDLGQECLCYEELIQANGGIDLQVLGIGQNGHIGFNEPGTSLHSKTHVVELAESTREANARFFPSIEEVPTQAITMGISTIVQSKQILLLVSGNKKEQALKRLLQGKISEEFPASILNQHENVTIIADKEALSGVLIES